MTLGSKLFSQVAPFRGGGFSVYGSFILFYFILGHLSPTVSTIQFAHSDAFCGSLKEDHVGECVVHQTFFSKLTCITSRRAVCGCSCVHTGRLLTCSVALHLNDTFGLLAYFPGVERPNSNGDFYRCPRHVCCSELCLSKTV